jgi:carbonic anhydrase
MKRKVIDYISRRNLFKFGATAVGTGLITSKLGLDLLDTPAVNAKQNLTPDLAIAELLKGNKRFSSQKTSQPNRGTFRLREVANGQKPFAAVLGCADSRVPAEIVFDQGLGDLFVVRVAGNVASSEEIGSLEFGSAVLGQIGSILKHIKPLKVASTTETGDLLKATTIANVKNQIATLKTSPVLMDLVNSGKLKIIGGFYSLDTGIITQVA